MKQSKPNATKPWTCDTTGYETASNKDNSLSIGNQALQTLVITTLNTIPPNTTGTCALSTFTWMKKTHYCLHLCLYTEPETQYIYKQTDMTQSTHHCEGVLISQDPKANDNCIFPFPTTLQDIASSQFPSLV